MGQWILTDVVFSLWVMCVHKLQQADFNLCLIQERLFVFDDFNSDVFFFLMVVSFANLKKKTQQMSSWTQLFKHFLRGTPLKKDYKIFRARAVFDGEKFCLREAKTVSELIFKVPLWSNSRYPFFCVFIHNRSFLVMLPNFKLLRTLQRAINGPLFPRV